MSASDFGTLPDGRRIGRFGLSDGTVEVDVTDFGATLVAVRAPDHAGRTQDVLLGHDHLDGYLAPTNQHLGATVGRVASRISGASFVLDGRTHRLTANEGTNHLHGGGAGAFSRVVWDVVTAADDRLELTHVSPDGAEGYPGRLEVVLVFTLADGRFRLDFRARTDARTPVNLTSHGYFNLGGEPAGNIGDHEIEVFAQRFTPAAADQILTGEIAEVAGSPVDLRAPTRLGERLPLLADDPPAGGFDHNYVVDGAPGELRPAARVVDPASGRSLELHTDQPCVQFYTGNKLNGSIIGRAGAAYRAHSGFCLEPQAFPDAVNRPSFPSVVLDPGREYRHVSEYRFGTV